MEGEEEGGVFYFAFCSPTATLYFFALGLSSCGNYRGAFETVPTTDRRRGTLCASPRLEARRINVTGHSSVFPRRQLTNLRMLSNLGESKPRPENSRCRLPTEGSQTSRPQASLAR
jgi:hypothetical protein